MVSVMSLTQFNHKFTVAAGVLTNLTSVFKQE